MQSDAEDGLNLITTAMENDNKDKLYLQYVQMIMWMDKDNFISFEEYYKQNTQSTIITKKVTKEEGYKKANDILAKVCKK